MVVATLCITKQKNLFKEACVHHGVLEGQIFACSMKVMARRVTHIWVHTYNGTHFLCEYWDSVGRGNVMDMDMSFHMKFTAAKLGYTRSKISLDRIETNLYRAIRVCPMKLEGFGDESIRRMGIWLLSSNDFSEYIQHQILGLFKGMDTKVSSIARYTNMGGSENHTG